MIEPIETIETEDFIIQFLIVDSVPKMIITEGDVVLDIDLTNVKAQVYSAINYMNLAMSR